MVWLSFRPKSGSAGSPNIFGALLAQASCAVPAAMVKLGAVALCGAALLQGSRADFMATADSLMTSAKSTLTSASNSFGSAKASASSLHATAQGHLAKASGYADKMEGYLCKFPYLKTMKSCVQDVLEHAQEPSGTAGAAASVFTPSAAAPYVPAAVAGAAAALPVPTTSGAAGCVGTECCPQSSCMSGSIPGLKCDSNRGATSCVGASMFSGKEGVCRCSSGACSSDGFCPDSKVVAGGVAPAPALPLASFFDADIPALAAPQEHMVLAFVCFWSFVGAMMLFAARVSWAFMRPRSRRAFSTQALMDYEEFEQMCLE